MLSNTDSQNGAFAGFLNLSVTLPDSAMSSGFSSKTGAPGDRSNFERSAQTTLGLVVNSKKYPLSVTLNAVLHSVL